LNLEKTPLNQLVRNIIIAIVPGISNGFYIIFFFFLAKETSHVGDTTKRLKNVKNSHTADVKVILITLFCLIGTFLLLCNTGTGTMLLHD
jgi:hypothetical protein